MVVVADGLPERLYGRHGGCTLRRQPDGGGWPRRVVGRTRPALSLRREPARIRECCGGCQLAVVAAASGYLQRPPRLCALVCQVVGAAHDGCRGQVQARLHIYGRHGPAALQRLGHRHGVQVRRHAACDRRLLQPHAGRPRRGRCIQYREVPQCDQRHGEHLRDEHPGRHQERSGVDCRDPCGRLVLRPGFRLQFGCGHTLYLGDCIA